MNRLLVPVAVLSLGLLTSPSPAEALEAHFGVKGGLNVANLRFSQDDLELQDSRKAAEFGAFAHFPLNEHFAVQPEALYTMKGDEEDVSGDYELDGEIIQLDGTVCIESSYLEVPVLARFTPAPDARVRPVLLVGPAVAVNLSTDSVVSGESGGVSIDVSDDISEDVKSVDLGLVLAGGLEFPVGSGGQNVGLDLRYTLGLTNVSDNSEIDDVKNGAFTVAGTFGFN
jgi:hypothetical protein